MAHPPIAPPTLPDRHPHPLTVEPESIEADREVTHMIVPRINGQLASVELLIRQLRGDINLWAESPTETTQPRGLCEEHEALVFGPGGGGLKLGDQRVVALPLPTETFETIQEDILSLQPEGMDPADSPAYLSAGPDDDDADRWKGGEKP
jgi:hypothetical protein